MKDVLGQAIAAYHQTASTAKLWVHNRYGPKEDMPVKIYFRKANDMPELEWVALQHCKGKVLDVGAGAGSHALLLQQMNLPVTALDISPLAVSVMKERGVKKIINKDFFLLPHTTKYDTLLLLMNGIGLAGSVDGLVTFLQKARHLLKPGGSLIFDSCDIAYLYGGKPPKGKPYYGEVSYQYEYRRMRGDWFKWLFIDRHTLSSIAANEGWQIELLYKDKFDQYLVRCSMLL